MGKVIIFRDTQTDKQNLPIIYRCSYVLNELSINPTKRVEEDDVGRKIVFWSVTQIREVGEAVICILRP